MIDLTFLDLARFAEDHYKQLKTKTWNRLDLIIDYFESLKLLQTETDSLEEKIKAALPGIRESSAIAITPAKTIFPNVSLYDDCLQILKELKSDFDILLKGTPEQIDQLVNKLKPFLSKHEVPGKKFGYQGYFKHFINALKFIWDYDDFTRIQTNAKTYDGYVLAKKLGVNSCPYCNRSYTFTVIKEYLSGRNPKSIKIVRPEFDHFYSKSRYPFLGVAFYNLVPSCYICNSTLKGDIEMSIKNHCHPYVEGYEDIFSFQTGISVQEYLDRGRQVPPVKFLPDPKADAAHIGRATATQEVFGIADIYPYHADIAGELFLKSIEESKATIDSYWNTKSKGGHHLYTDKADLYRHFVGNFYTKKDFYKRPLSKFHFDILKETQLLKYFQDLPLRPDPASSVPVTSV